MLDVRWLLENEELARQKMAQRRFSADLDGLFERERRRRALLQEADALRSARNAASEQIARLKKSGQDASGLIERMRGVSEQISTLEKDLGEMDAEVGRRLLNLPNIQHDSVPAGESSEDNPVLRHWGEKPSFSYTPKGHVEIGEALGVLDFKRGAKLSGARFTVMTDLGARLERALINFMLDLHVYQHGYVEVMPPSLVTRESMTGTGQLPHLEDDLFKTRDEDLFLIPTAEVPVTNLHRDEILAAEQLPIKYVSFTPCYRREAGSYGKDVRGLIRQHQFNKVELVKFSNPESSYDELEGLTADAEEVLKRLNLHYRVVALCTADLGFASAKTYDIEVWLPSENTYREISSCSNFTDYQTRRMKIRFRPGPKAKPELVHSLNGSALAVGRTLVAVLENYQLEDGSVRVPEALAPYMGGVTVISAKQ